jgi:hypothetical protein
MSNEDQPSKEIHPEEVETMGKGDPEENKQ